jgi:hypothetical protein
MKRTKDWEEYTKSELLKLPHRSMDEAEKEYDYVLLVNTRTKHSSGYNLFAVIGAVDDDLEIVGHCDDFRNYNSLSNSICKSFAIDCSMHGVFRIWLWDKRKIQIGRCLSTMEFIFIN